MSKKTPGGKNNPQDQIKESPQTEDISLSPLEEAIENPIPEIKNEKIYEKDENGVLRTIRMDSEPLGEELTLRQKRFCQLYALDSRFMGNGTRAYDEVYDLDKSKPGWAKVAQAAASRLLSNVIICKYINSLLTTAGFNDENADSQLNYLMNQHADLGVKKSAIDSYNKLKKRISDKQTGDIILVTPTAINIIKPE